MSWYHIGEILHYIHTTLILMARLIPEAKNPPNGPIKLANNAMIIICPCKREIVKMARSNAVVTG